MLTLTCADIIRCAVVGLTSQFRYRNIKTNDSRYPIRYGRFVQANKCIMYTSMCSPTSLKIIESCFLLLMCCVPSTINEKILEPPLHILATCNLLPVSKQSKGLKNFICHVLEKPVFIPNLLHAHYLNVFDARISHIDLIYMPMHRVRCLYYSSRRNRASSIRLYRATVAVMVAPTIAM